MDNPVIVSHTDSNADIHNFLVRRLGEKEGSEIMSYINKEVELKVAKKVTDSKNEITLWREEMKTVFATKEDAERLRGRLLKRVSKAENTLLLWTFVFWLTALIIIFCIIEFV
jgi:predicted PilT family ATPase